LAKSLRKHKWKRQTESHRILSWSVKKQNEKTWKKQTESLAKSLIKQREKLNKGTRQTESLAKSLIKQTEKLNKGKKQTESLAKSIIKQWQKNLIKERDRQKV